MLSCSHSTSTPEPDSLGKRNIIFYSVLFPPFHHTVLIYQGLALWLPSGFLWALGIRLSEPGYPVSGFESVTSKVQYIRHCGQVVEETEKKSVSCTITGSNPVYV